MSVTVLGGPGAPFAEVEMRVTGVGFERSQAEQLFRRFHREPADSSGSGLGLTIAHALVEAHGDTLTGKSGGRAGAPPSRSPFPRRQAPQARVRSSWPDQGAAVLVSVECKRAR